MRLGDTDRANARVGLMGRRKVAQLHRTAEAAGWLDVATPLPDDPELTVHLGSVRTQPAVASLAEPHRERITGWWRQGVQGTTIHDALVRSHGFNGSYSSVRRFLAGVEAAYYCKWASRWRYQSGSLIAAYLPDPKKSDRDSSGDEYE